MADHTECYAQDAHDRSPAGRRGCRKFRLANTLANVKIIEKAQEVVAIEATVTTADGHTVTAGARVFDYYDGHWGTIGDSFSIDGWFDHYREDGKGRGYLNGERVCVRIPRSNPFYDSHGSGNPR